MNRINNTTCPLCSGTQFSEPIAVIDSSISKETFHLITCKACQFTLTQDPPTPESIGPYYQSEDYVSHSDSKKGLINSIYHQVRDFMLYRKADLVKQRSKGNQMLDIGSGTGYFLNTMQKEGFEVKGVEINDEARKLSQEKFGLKVHEPSEFLSDRFEKQFDVISLWHVLEHLYDLNGYMKAIDRSLKNSGTLIIAVPNKDSFDGKYYEANWAGLDVPRHLWHFTPASMQTFAGKYGWKIVSKKILPFDSFYVSLLSEKYQKSPFATIKGFLVGTVSLISAVLNVKNSSSVIYVLEKEQ
ncbi:class I SAM-dependent methyltransferase [Jiulongibacter sp. NS-SX5]|uniref:class I SAM-dependent methyltransferase n=1 Tax=Jiulongibacter sp. NS-SX5 TaxID=3463854 RepID=UPI004058A552